MVKDVLFFVHSEKVRCPSDSIPAFPNCDGRLLDSVEKYTIYSHRIYS